MSNATVSSSYVVMESLGRSAKHFVVYPLKHKGNNWTLTESWDMFLNKMGPLTSINFEYGHADPHEPSLQIALSFLRFAT